MGDRDGPRGPEMVAANIGTAILEGPGHVIVGMRNAHLWDRLLNGAAMGAPLREFLLDAEFLYALDRVHYGGAILEMDTPEGLVLMMTRKDGCVGMHLEASQ